MPLDTVDKDKLTAVLRQFQGRQILVIGDVIVSRFVEVAARKLAREAPVPAGDFIGQTLLPGGAANLARELASLGASVRLVGLLGSDEYGSWLKSEFSKYGLSFGGMVTDPVRPTSLRTWYMVNGFHMLRIDKEDRRDVPSATAKKLLAEAEPQIKDVDCVILSDYDRGAITSYLIGGVVSAAHASDKIVVGQPKMHHYLDFSGVTYVKSNLEEAEHATGMAMVNETSLRNMGVNLLSRLESKAILITRGEQGVTLFDKDNVTLFPPITGRKNLFSKVGVRDAMTGVFSLAVASGGNPYQAAVLSNIAGEARSELPRIASLSLHDLEAKAQSAQDFVQRIIQAPVRR
ncbi:MAG TPA: PfkB family carbohydrate kinase [Nitrososphaerales archaeon]|nr:PfkB family carbohydrate kinase [Nitrososphaerales archaeon]